MAGWRDGVSRARNGPPIWRHIDKNEVENLVADRGLYLTESADLEEHLYCWYLPGVRISLQAHAMYNSVKKSKAIYYGIDKKWRFGHV